MFYKKNASSTTPYSTNHTTFRRSPLTTTNDYIIIKSNDVVATVAIHRSRDCAFTKRNDFDIVFFDRQPYLGEVRCYYVSKKHGRDDGDCTYELSSSRVRYYYNCDSCSPDDLLLTTVLHDNRTSFFPSDIRNDLWTPIRRPVSSSSSSPPVAFNYCCFVTGLALPFAARAFTYTISNAPIQQTGSYARPAGFRKRSVGDAIPEKRVVIFVDGTTAVPTHKAPTTTYQKRKKTLG